MPSEDDPSPVDARILARLAGGAFSESATGTASVSFLQRAPDPAVSAAAPPIPAPAPPLAPAAPPERNEDALYDRIVKRLRRELLDDRERRGRSIGEGRW